ncbi:MAG TPA: DUF4386 family protein [Candidatus Limnocylindrales bacterium]|nr:DUF4386 family protein [Candidatus Limnocylindrales bacterium]
MIQTRPLTTTPDGSRAAEPAQADATWRRVYRAGGVAALAVVALVLIQAPIFILYPYPTTVLAHLTQIHDHKLIGLINADLIMLVSELLAAVTFIALFGVLRQGHLRSMTVALGAFLIGMVLYVASNPTFALLYLSDQYAGATSAAQRASFLAAGEAVWATYQGTPFAVAFILGGVAALIVATVMLRSGRFGRWTAYLGLLVGATMMLPPLPALGPVALAISYVSLLPMIVWYALVGLRLLRLASAPGSGAPAVKAQRSRASLA